MLQTLEPLDEGRKCFRLVGGVLVEQTVGTARPTVQGNMDNLKVVGLLYPACNMDHLKLVGFRALHAPVLRARPRMEPACSWHCTASQKCKRNGISSASEMVHPP